jgi:hypothetical protein
MATKTRIQEMKILLCALKTSTPVLLYGQQVLVVSVTVNRSSPDGLPQHRFEFSDGSCVVLRSTEKEIREEP